MKHHKYHFNNKTAKITLWLVLLFITVQPVMAQSPVTVKVDRNTLARHEQVTLTISVTGDFLSVSNPDLSQLENFVVVSSSSSTQVSIVNGQMSSQRVFVYRLQPLAEGMLEIGPIPVIVGSKIHKTEPIEVEVLPTGSQTAPPDSTNPDTLDGRNFFVEAEVDNANPYLGEQILYTFKVYQATQFPPGQPDYEPPNFTDFWSSEILAQPHYSTVVDGRNYSVTEITTALFPANLGAIVIQPASLLIPGGILSPDIRLESNPVTVDVQPLPNNAPDDFAGAVGQYDIKASLSSGETKVNEPVTLLIEIEGIGNVENIIEPELPELSNWRLFESQASTTTDTSEGKLTGVRSFERLIVPGQPGEQTIPSIQLSYFDPQLEDYQTASTEPLPITVLPDDSAQVPIAMPGFEAEDDETPGTFTLDIRHIKPVPASLKTTFNASVLGWGIYAGCWLFPALAVGSVYVWRRRQRRLKEDTAYARDQRAQRIAMKILNMPAAGTEADAAGRALLGYLSDKLNMPVSGLTTNGLIALLRKSRLRENLVQRVENIMHRIDVGRYAPISDEAGQGLLADTRHLIKDLEKAFGKRR